MERRRAVDFNNIFIKKVNLDDREIKRASNSLREMLRVIRERFGHIFNRTTTANVADVDDLDFSVKTRNR